MPGLDLHEGFRVKRAQEEIPLSGEAWAAKSEAYAALISEHLTAGGTWLDAGCGWRLLEDDMDRLEDWLVEHCGQMIGMDLGVKSHRNIRRLVQGSLYALPFADGSLDLITSNMVLEHLDQPVRAFAEVARCLSPGGAFVVKTPNLLNYAVMGNAVAAKVMPAKWRLRLVQGSDGRAAEDFFPVRYKANTMRRLVRLLEDAGLRVHKTVELPQQRPFLPKIEKVERMLMKVTPISGLLVCAHKVSTA
jgi:SAM-dependent methyltransferase